MKEKKKEEKNMRNKKKKKAKNTLFSLLHWFRNGFVFLKNVIGLWN